MATQSHLEYIDRGKESIDVPYSRSYVWAVCADCGDDGGRMLLPRDFEEEDFFIRYPWMNEFQPTQIYRRCNSCRRETTHLIL